MTAGRFLIWCLVVVAASIAISITMVMASGCAPVTDDPMGVAYPAMREAIDLIRLHESLNGTRMRGDGGKARGWLHQHEGHWGDGVAFLGLSGRKDWQWPEATLDLEKAEHIAGANWVRYSREYLDNRDELIRRFRLPFDPYRKDNDEYLKQVLEKRKYLIKGKTDG